VTKIVNDKDVTVKVESQFPWNGDVKITVDAEGTDFVLALRVPDWCDSYEIDACYKECMEEKDGYLYITKAWGHVEIYSDCTVSSDWGFDLLCKYNGKLLITAYRAS